MKRVLSNHKPLKGLLMLLAILFVMPQGVQAEIEYEDAKVSVTHEDDNTELFASFEAAYAAAKSGDVIQLLSDCNVAANTIASVDNVYEQLFLQLDLNEHKLSFPNGGYLEVETLVDLFIGGGTISAGDVCIHNSGVLRLRACTIEATTGVGISGDGTIEFHELPTFNCQKEDIALAKDKQFYFGSDVTISTAPAKKIKVSLQNEAPYMFTHGFSNVFIGENLISPEDVFISTQYGADAFGFMYGDGTYEAGLAPTTEITFPVGMSTYYDSRALALYGENENLTFYTVTGLDVKKDDSGKVTEAPTVLLTEITGKKFAEHTPLIVSNTSDAAIKAKMLAAFEGPMASNYLNALYTNMGEKNIYAYFEGTDEELDEIFVPEGFEFSHFSFNTDRFSLRSSNASVAAHTCWLGIDKQNLPESTTNSLGVRWPDGTTTGLKLVEIEDSWVTVAQGPFTYTGKEIKPTVTVKEGETDVTKCFDVTYSNNTNANDGTGTAAPTITVSANASHPEYTGEVSLTFAIGKAPVTITTGSASKAYDGSALTKAEASIAGLVNGETATVTATGSQTVVGTSNNTYTINWGTTNKGNYTLTESLGTLTVTLAKMTGVSVTGWSGVIDGYSHSPKCTIPEGATITFMESKGGSALSSVPSYKTTGTYKVYYRVTKNNYEPVEGDVTIDIKPAMNKDGKVTINGKTYNSLSEAALKLMGNLLTPNLQGIVFGLLNSVSADDVNYIVDRIVVSEKGQLIISQGPAVILGVLQAHAGEILTITTTIDGKVTIDKEKLVELILAGKVRALSRTRGESDEMVIESGVKYLVLEDCDLFFKLHTEDAPVTIESINLRQQASGDANGDNVVNVADIVKLVKDKAPQADIDAVVKIIMGE